MKLISIFCAFTVCVLFYSCAPTNEEPISAKIMTVVVPGTLDSLLSNTDKKTLTKLTIRGTIDARDIKYMRDSMTLLTDIDLKDVNIAEYVGEFGTMGPFDWTYPSNTLADGSFSKLMSENSSLKSIILPSSLTSIGRHSLSQCTALTSISIPSGVSSIQTGAFYACTALTSITIPASVSSLHNDAFRKCSGLTTISLQHGITSIGNSAFRDCSNLKSITIPESVTSIAINMFVGCSSLTTILVDTKSNFLSSIEGVLYTKDKKALLCCPGGKLGVYTVPSNVTTIESGAFSGCLGLSSIIVPNSVSIIKDYAFQACINLSSIYSYSAKPIDLKAAVSPFEGINTSTCILYVPVGSKNLYQAAYQWNQFSDIEEIQ